MNKILSGFGGLVAVGALLSLAACATPANQKEVAEARGIAPDCPVGTMICRRDHSQPSDAVSAEALRNQGVTHMGGSPAVAPHGGG